MKQIKLNELPEALTPEIIDILVEMARKEEGKTIEWKVIACELDDREELDLFSDVQIEKVSIEGLKAHLRMLESSRKEEERIKLFWVDEYTAHSTSEKARIRGADIHRSMRWQGESGYDEYDIFTEKWLKGALEEDPDFMTLLPEIYYMQGMSFDSEKADKIIQQLYKKIKKSE